MFRPQILCGCLIGILMVAPLSHARTEVDETLQKVSQWVETERMIVRDRETWQTEQASIGNLIEVFNQELDALREQIRAAEEDTSAAEQQRAELLEQDRILRELEEQVTAQLMQAELRLKALYQRLPPPLQQELRPLAVAMPDDPRNTNLSLGQRIQPVAAMLTQIQRFNAAVTVVDDFREFEAGNPVQVKSVFFGLGPAFYVDGANQHAGVGFLGANGWEWRDDPSIAPQVREFLNIYGGTQQAKYIFLPVEIRR